MPGILWDVYDSRLGVRFSSPVQVLLRKPHVHIIRSNEYLHDLTFGSSFRDIARQDKPFRNKNAGNLRSRRFYFTRKQLILVVGFVLVLGDNQRFILLPV